jgi:hypothetical protein
MEAGSGPLGAVAIADAALTAETVDDDGESLPDDVAAELAVTAEAERELTDERAAGLEAALAASQRELEAERRLTRSAVDRYRHAALAAEPELPPELVRGETLEEIEESIAEARATVAQIRERIGATAEAGGAGRGFPVGAPARSGAGTASMSSAEKIAYGLEQRAAAG